MFRKTVKEFRRRVKSGTPTLGGIDTHTERVKVETWWLLWLLPVYSRETIVATNL